MDKKKGNFREAMSTRALRTYVVNGRWDLIKNIPRLHGGNEMVVANEARSAELAIIIL